MTDHTSVMDPRDETDLYRSWWSGLNKMREDGYEPDILVVNVWSWCCVGRPLKCYGKPIVPLSRPVDGLGIWMLSEYLEGICQGNG